MTAQPGDWYVVGRHDGSIEPFYIKGRITTHGNLRYVPPGYVATKLLRHERYWFELQEIPSTVPKSFQTDQEKG